ncbi:ferredoxin--NADP(+) reductase [Theileria orientalis]|uniref:Ferredoxin--NADP(+) reductase n=1 Tax=Theileria orientalis TaxID=68886 RepID=A0A976QQT7_THEOR|nr:ferredoxin--NADP(+) reductase [Theileria orientalis]
MKSSGVSPRTNRRHTPRSYSLAPALDGNDQSTLSICIRVTRPDDPNLGICSRFLSRSESGTEVNLTGPFGKNLTLTEEDIRANNLILIATGTGISPFRGFLKRIWDDAGFVPGRRIVLFFGVQNQSTFLYREEFEKYKRLLGDTLEIIPCYSREPNQPKVYVQESILINSKPLCDLANSGTKCSIFVCGRKDMEKPVREALNEVYKNIGEPDKILGGAKYEVYQ